jgi:hypothetical protein
VADWEDPVKMADASKIGIESANRPADKSLKPPAPSIAKGAP